jgi:hypothetical protein
MTTEIQFGLEFETLILAPKSHEAWNFTNSYKTFVDQGVAQINTMFSGHDIPEKLKADITNIGIGCLTAPKHDTFRKTLSRFGLGLHLNKKLSNELSAKAGGRDPFAYELFKVAPGYKENACTPYFKNLKELVKQRGWIIDNDSSVKLQQDKSRYTKFYTSYNNTFKRTIIDNNVDNVMENIEFVSPIFVYTPEGTPPEKPGLLELTNCFNTMTVHSAKVDGIDIETTLKSDFDLFYFNNSTTSNHIHFSLNKGEENILKIQHEDVQKDGKTFNKDSPENITEKQRNLLKLVKAWWFFEPVFFALCPRWRRDNEYCKSMRTILNDSFEKDVYEDMFYDFDSYTYESIEQIVSIFQGDPGEKSTRYAGFNMMNLLGDESYGTVEIRIKHGSTDVQEMILFIKLFAEFIKYSMTLSLEKVTQDFTEIEKFVLFSDDNKKTLVAKFDILKSKLDGTLSVDDYKHLAQLLVDFNPDLNFPASKFPPKTIHVQNSPQKDAQDDGGDTSMGAAGGGSSQLSKKRYPYFSFGSNHSKQLSERTGSKCLEPLPAYLNNFTRIFAGYSKFREGGVASVYPIKGARVYGCVFQLTQAEMDILDQYEGGYTRSLKLVNVTLPNGEIKKVRCFIYIRDDHIYTHGPSQSYMQAIRTMLDEAKPMKKGKIHIRGVVTEGEGRKKTHKLKTFGYFFRNKLTMYKKPMVFQSDSVQSRGQQQQAKTVANKRIQQEAPVASPEQKMESAMETSSSSPMRSSSPMQESEQHQFKSATPESSSSVKKSSGFESLEQTPSQAVRR